MNLSKYRLIDWDWQLVYVAQMGEESYNAYACKVWGALDRLRENEYYNVEKQVKEERWDLFIKLCCQYILTHSEYEFSNDYTKIIRRECYMMEGNPGRLVRKSS